MIASRRGIVASLVVAGLLLGLAGCWALPEAPRELVAEASAYAAEVRELPGVASAEATVRAVDPKDKPGEWAVELLVATTSAAGLATVPGAVAGIRPPSSSGTRYVIHIPAGPDAAPVTLSDLTADSAERAGVLRALSFADSVSVGDYGDSVEVVEGTGLSAAIEGIRRSGTLTVDPFDSVSVGSPGSKSRVAVSLAGPSAALVRVIEQAEGDPAVESISSSEPSENTARPVVFASTSDPQRLAAVLAALVGDEQEGRPHTAFSVHSDTDEIEGFVGLPLGSPRPDDLYSAPPSPAPVDDATIASDTQAVTEFLLAAATVSAIPGMPEVLVGECTNGGGSQVQGNLLLPVFEYVDSADPAYDAIVESWQSAGYTHSDQAMGTSIYSPISARPVVQVSIRGTSEGIRISALGACRA